MHTCLVHVCNGAQIDTGVTDIYTIFFQVNTVMNRFSSVSVPVLCAINVCVLLCFSVKFGKKLMYVNYLVELRNHLPFDQLTVPLPVLE